MEEVIQKAITAIEQYAVEIVISLIILFVGRLASRWLSNLTRKLLRKRGTDETLVRFISNLMHGLLLAVVIIAALNQLGVETTSLVAIVGAAGLAIGLALQSSLSNFAAGVMLILFRPFKTGDFVEAAGTAGIVEAVQMFTTTMNTPDNKHIIVPNAKIISENITNYTAKDVRRLDLIFGISYGDDIKKAREVLLDVITSDPRVLEEPAPVIGVLTLGDSSVDFAVRPWVKTADYWECYFAITEQVKLRFDAEGISIPFPQRDVHLRQAH